VSENNLVSSLDDKFQRMEKLIESFLHTAYEWDSIDPMEVALFLQVLAGKQMKTALEIHMNLNEENVNAVAKTQVDHYNQHKQLDDVTFVGEMIGLQAIAGTRMMKFHSIINDFKHVDREVITAADLDDGGPM